MRVTRATSRFADFGAGGDRDPERALRTARLHGGSVHALEAGLEILDWSETSEAELEAEGKVKFFGLNTKRLSTCSMTGPQREARADELRDR